MTHQQTVRRKSITEFITAGDDITCRSQQGPADLLILQEDSRQTSIDDLLGTQITTRKDMLKQRGPNDDRYSQGSETEDQTSKRQGRMITYAARNDWYSYNEAHEKKMKIIECTTEKNNLWTNMMRSRHNLYQTINVDQEWLGMSVLLIFHFHGDF